MYIIVDETDSKALKARAMDITEATLEQDLRNDCYAALVSDPPEVHATKVVDPKLHIRELSRAMSTYIKSAPFRKLLDLDKDHASCISLSGIFDANILETVSCCLPATMKAALFRPGRPSQRFS